MGALLSGLMLPFASSYSGGAQVTLCSLKAVKDYRDEKTPFWTAPWFKYGALAVLAVAAAFVVALALSK